MKTTLKLTLSIITLLVLLSSCGTMHKCYEGPAESDRDETTSIEESFKNETPAKEVKTKWTPAAERGSSLVETEPKIASVNSELENEDIVKDENSASDKNLEKERKSKFGKTKRSKVKEIVNAVKKHKKNNKRDSGAMLVLLVILAIILPPLAVGIYEGITGRFWLVLVLWLLGIGLLAWLLPGLFYLGGLIAIILALLIVLGAW